MLLLKCWLLMLIKENPEWIWRATKSSDVCVYDCSGEYNWHCIGIRPPPIGPAFVSNTLWHAWAKCESLWIIFAILSFYWLWSKNGCCIHMIGSKVERNRTCVFWLLSVQTQCALRGSSCQEDNNVYSVQRETGRVCFDSYFSKPNVPCGTVPTKEITICFLWSGFISKWYIFLAI